MTPLRQWMLSMMGWPKTVQALISAQELLPALIAQEEAERKAYREPPGNRHLARHEIAELYGLSPSPPTP